MHNFFKERNFNLALGSAAIVIILSALYQWKKRQGIPKNWKLIGTVTGLYLHPLKSGKILEAKSLTFTKVGPKESETKTYQLKDREFSVYDPKTTLFVTAREYPKIFLIEVTVHDSNHFALNAPGMEEIIFKMPAKSVNKAVTLTLHFNEKILALDCGDETSMWISQYLTGEKNNLRLAHSDDQFKRDVETPFYKFLPLYKNLNNSVAGLFSDLTSVHLINESSVADLRSKMKGSNISVNNFRPNIAVESAAYAENEWDWIKIGNAVLRFVKPCTRCIMTTIDKETGIKNEDTEPLRTLRKYHILENEEMRKVDFYAPVMGLYLSVVKPGEINVGDKVYISGKSTVKVIVKNN